jgi:hypothetical protein
MQVSQLPAAELSELLAQIQSPLSLIVGVSLIFAALVAILFWVRRTRLAGRSRADAVTWDCGYAAHSSRMQYSAASFAQPLMHLTAGVVRLRHRLKKPEGYFPTTGFFSTETPDVVEKGMWTPIFKSVEWLLSRFRWIQIGSIHLYILYIAITLIVLLIWKLR